MKLSKAFVWRVALVSMTLIALSMAVMTWSYGEQETQDALFSGRRLVIDRQTGIVHGKMAASKPEQLAAAEAPKQETPADAQKLESGFVEEDAASGEVATEVRPEPAPQKTFAEEKPLDSFAFLNGQAAADKPPEPEKKPEPTKQEKSEQEKEDEAKIAAAIESAPILSSAPTLSPSANALPELNKKLAESSEHGLIPAIGSDGTKPWKFYGKNAEVKKGTPSIAIIITGLGKNRIVAENAVKLPEEISLSFSPYSRDTTGWGNASRLTGHETLVDLPLEPSNYPIIDPGPYGLLVEKGAQENEKRLTWVMSRFSSYVGLVTPLNEKFSSDLDSLKILLQSVANRGLLMVMGSEPHKSESKTLVDSSTTPLVIADMLIDEELSATAIQTRLASLEHLAKKRGYAIGIVQPYPISIEQLRLWSETLKDKGIVLVPISAVAKLRFS